MSTITMEVVPPVGATPADKKRFARILAAKNAVFAAPGRMASWLARQSQKGVAGDLLDFIRTTANRWGTPVSWLKEIVTTAGRGMTVVALAGIPVVRKIVSTVVSKTYSVVRWIGETIHDGIDWFLRLFGKPGNWLADKIDRAVTKVTTTVRKVVSYVIDKVDLWTNPETSKGARYITQGAQMVAGSRLISRFIPGPVGYIARAALALLVSKDVREIANSPIQRARQVLNEKKVVHEATEATKEAGEAFVSTMEAKLGITPREVVQARKAAEKAEREARKAAEQAVNNRVIDGEVVETTSTVIDSTVTTVGGVVAEGDTMVTQVTETIVDPEGPLLTPEEQEAADLLEANLLAQAGVGRQQKKQAQAKARRKR